MGPMKKLLLASTILTLAGPALAADLPKRMPVKAPPPVVAPVPYFSWTGCYLGGHVGAGWGRKDFSEPDTEENFAPPGGVIAFDTGAGFLGGGQVGCNYQFATNWVLGIEGDFAWADLKGDATDPFFSGKSGFLTRAPILLHAKTTWLTDVTGRFGYAWNRWWLYAKGGVAWTHDRFEIDNVQTSFAVSSGCFFNGCNFIGDETRTGWVVGVGLEWAFWNNWSAKLEFDHYDFGTKQAALFNPVHDVSIPADVKQRTEAVKFGINYRFGWGKTPTPVVAKY
jgi:outer membrane immunogenic protein